MTDQFRTDNTEGFTTAQLQTMNDEFYRDLSIVLDRLPEGADGIEDGDMAEQIKQSVAEAVLRRHGAA